MFKSSFQMLKSEFIIFPFKFNFCSVPFLIKLFYLSSLCSPHIPLTFNILFQSHFYKIIIVLRCLPTLQKKPTTHFKAQSCHSFLNPSKIWLQNILPLLTILIFLSFSKTIFYILFQTQRMFMSPSVSTFPTHPIQIPPSLVGPL